MDRTNDTLLLVGRLLMAAMFLPSGIGKLMGFTAFAASLATKGLPFPMFWAVAAITIEILAAIALIIGCYTRPAALALIAFVIMATATTHRYWEFAEPARRIQEIMFSKNIGLIGGLLFYMVNGAGGWAWRGGKT